MGYTVAEILNYLPGSHVECVPSPGRNANQGEGIVVLRNAGKHTYRNWGVSRYAPYGETDADLITRVLEGDRRAGEEFVERFRGQIYGTLRKAGIPPDEREDLCQIVFVHLWGEHCRRLRNWQMRGPFRAFLSTVVMRIAIERHRQNQTVAPPLSTLRDSHNSEREYDPSATEVCMPSLVFARQRVTAMQEALRLLASRDAELIRRRHLLGESYQEMATGLDMTVNNVGVALYRAEIRLRHKLERSSPQLFDASPEVYPSLQTSNCRPQMVGSEQKDRQKIDCKK
jgi:RNA polymerase sigma factor (sigma-70 family)